MTPYCPDQGDIISLDFDPSSGSEIMKRRPALVLTRRVLNEHTGLAVVVPITSTIREVKIEFVLPDNLETQGAVLLWQLRALDFKARNAQYIESAKEIMVEVQKTIAILLK